MDTQDPVIAGVEKPPKWYVTSKIFLTAIGGILLILLPMVYEGLRTGVLTLPPMFEAAMPWIMMFLLALIAFFRIDTSRPLSLKRPDRDT